MKLHRDTGVMMAKQPFNNSDPLTKIGMVYGTDKATLHRFTSFYNTLFSEKRRNVRRFLEIGVYKGESIEMWRDYFTSAKVFGIDIFSERRGQPTVLSARSAAKIGSQPGMYRANLGQAHWDRLDPKKNPLVFGSRVQLLDVNMSDPSEMSDIAHDRGSLASAPLDIVIEDGSHFQRDQQIALAKLFPLVAPGGLYVVEDIASSYAYAYDEPPGSKYTSAEILRTFNATGKLQSKWWSRAEVRYLETWIESAVLVSTYRRRWDLVALVRKREMPCVLGGGGAESARKR